MSTSGAQPAADVDADVAIVGAGPVGLTLGILLAQAGGTVVVLERWPAPYPLPRAVHFDHEVGRILQSCGIGPELRAISEAAEIYEWRNAAGTTLLRFGRRRRGAVGLARVVDVLPAGARGAPRGAAPARSDARASGAGVEITAIDQHDDHVVVGDAAGARHRGRYVVGCDGANSTVRGLVGIDVVDLGFFYDWLIVDVVLDEPRVFDPLNLQICDPARPTTAVSGGPGRRRWEFMRLADEIARRAQRRGTARGSCSRRGT